MELSEEQIAKLRRMKDARDSDVTHGIVFESDKHGETYIVDSKIEIWRYALGCSVVGLNYGTVKL